MAARNSPRQPMSQSAVKALDAEINRIAAMPSVPTMLRQSPAGSLSLRAEVETSHGYACYH